MHFEKVFLGNFFLGENYASERQPVLARDSIRTDKIYLRLKKVNQMLDGVY